MKKAPLTMPQTHGPSTLSRRWIVALGALRRQVRDRELALILMALALGAVVGLVTLGLRDLVAWLHRFAFALPPGEFLSGQLGLETWRQIAVPGLGGLMLGSLTLALNRLRPAELVDPIEANALHGGQLSLRDSGRLVLLTLGSGLVLAL